jgi:putative transposase
VRRQQWHLDEVVITIAAKKHRLWRAVEQEGFVLDVLVQSQRDKKAAKREIMPGVEHWQHKGLNNRAENYHQPTRRRERIMKRFKSPRQVAMVSLQP